MERESLFRHTDRVCSVAVCDRPVWAVGLCNGHYQRLRAHGDPGTTAIGSRGRNSGLCAVDGCERPGKSRGWCFMHYQRWRTHGDPNLRGRSVPQHGTVTMYSNHGCRCDDCRKANTVYVRERGIAGYKTDLCACGNPKRVVAAKCRACWNADREAPHGTESRYKHCRCDECRTASAEGRRTRREARRVPCVSCGTLVHAGRRDKPPECRPCALARIHRERKAVAV